eukprot:4875083-Pleurochrysis_carterae.AAC.3
MQSNVLPNTCSARRTPPLVAFVITFTATEMSALLSVRLKHPYTGTPTPTGQSVTRRRVTSSNLARPPFHGPQRSKLPLLSRPAKPRSREAASEAAKEAVYLRAFFGELGLAAKEPSPLSVDSKAAIDLAYNPEHHTRTKHIVRRHFFVREKVEEHAITVRRGPTFFALRDAVMIVPCNGGYSQQYTPCARGHFLAFAFSFAAYLVACFPTSILCILRMYVRGTARRRLFFLEFGLRDTAAHTHTPSVASGPLQARHVAPHLGLATALKALRPSRSLHWRVWAAQALPGRWYLRGAVAYH